MLIACVAVVALVGIVYMVLTASKNIVLSPTAAVSPAASETQSAPATPPATSSKQTTPPAPTPSTPATSTENDPRFRLTGIMKMGDSFGAVINGRVVYQDNYVDGGVVKKVERDRVTLDVNGRETVLRLF
jgi:type II secretory pathway component PulC